MAYLFQFAVVAGAIAAVIYAVSLLLQRTRPDKEAIKANERQRNRELYEKLVREKLEVLKTAIALGYDDVQLAKLDTRLEELIGKDELKRLLGDADAAPRFDEKLLTADMDGEIAEIKREINKSKE